MANASCFKPVKIYGALDSRDSNAEKQACRDERATVISTRAERPGKSDTRDALLLGNRGNRSDTISNSFAAHDPPCSESRNELGLPILAPLQVKLSSSSTRLPTEGSRFTRMVIEELSRVRPGVRH